MTACGCGSTASRSSTTGPITRPTENSGTIALTAGQRYDIRMEFYENGGGATSRGCSWSSASVPKARGPEHTALPFRRDAHRDPDQLPAGGGAGARRVSRRRRARLRRSRQRPDLRLERRQHALRRAIATPRTRADQRYDTLTHLQKPANPDAVWEIAVPNGTYVVRVVSGDAGELRQRVPHTVEGVLTVTGTPTTSTRWIEGTSTVDRDRRPAHHPQRRRGERTTRSVLWR